MCWGGGGLVSPLGVLKGAFYDAPRRVLRRVHQGLNALTTFPALVTELTEASGTGTGTTDTTQTTVATATTCTSTLLSNGRIDRSWRSH